MLKAVAQVVPFLGLLFGTAAVGAAVVGLVKLAGRRGHQRGWSWVLVIAGIVLLVAGVLLFAPQPLWVGAVLVAVGTVRLGRRRSEHLGSRRS